MWKIERPIVHDILRASDCAVVSFDKNAQYDHGISPNQLFDYCLLAPPSVIACEQNVLTGLEDLATLRCTPDDPNLLAHESVSALSSPERPLSQRVAAIQQFGYSELAARYLA
jgi:hypothetical protein